MENRLDFRTLYPLDFLFCFLPLHSPKDFRLIFQFTSFGLSAFLLLILLVHAGCLLAGLWAGSGLPVFCSTADAVFQGLPAFLLFAFLAFAFELLFSGLWIGPFAPASSAFYSSGCTEFSFWLLPDDFFSIPVIFVHCPCSRFSPVLPVRQILLFKEQKKSRNSG